ncbi:MAG: response regulator [Anaerolineae bacterium]|nr:response regulator [Anaerolineae bacterium]
MTNFKGKQALIVEDDPVSISVLEKLLSRLEVQSIVMDGYADVAGLLADVPGPDVIFLDLEMPGKDGYQMLEVLKAHPKAQHVPIVAYTTHLSHVNQTREAGFDGFLGKPLDRHEFPLNLERILNGEDVWVIP